MSRISPSCFLRAGLASVVTALLGLVGCARPELLFPEPPPPGATKELPSDRPTYDQPAKVKPIAGMKSALFAKEPLVEDPVSFCFDDAGRLYLAESARQERGIEDNRSSKWWLMDDLQSQTVEDRLKMYEKWASKREGGMDYYRRYEDRVRRIERVCQAHDVPLKAAALQFVLAHPAIPTHVPGTRTVAQMEDNLTAFRTEIPAAFWSDLKREGLIRQDAPVPG